MRSLLATFIISFLFVFTNCQSLLGGYKPADVNDENVQSMSKYAIDHVNLQLASSGKPIKYDINKINSASSQVVAGVNYKIIFELKKQDCSEDCLTTCTAVVYVRPWDKFKDLTRIDCDKKIL